MRGGFAAVEEKGDSVAAKFAGERLVIIFQIADEHGAIAETVSGADKFQNFARGENGLGFSVHAGNEADGILGFGFWVLSWL